jgi:transposase-like protein
MLARNCPGGHARPPTASSQIQPRRSHRHHLPDQRRLLKTVLQTALDEQMSEHLGYEKGDRAAARTRNHRNGGSPKIVRTAVGPVELAIPRDRNGSFEPKIVP